MIPDDRGCGRFLLKPCVAQRASANQGALDHRFDKTGASNLYRLGGRLLLRMTGAGDWLDLAVIRSAAPADNRDAGQ